MVEEWPSDVVHTEVGGSIGSLVGRVEVSARHMVGKAAVQFLLSSRLQLQLSVLQSLFHGELDAFYKRSTGTWRSNKRR